jgi:CO/xanthine dehydrogenase FAD-binding subunit
MLASINGPTSMPADDFFLGAMVTAIGEGECVSAIRFPVWPHRRIGVGFLEISARRSDFAFVAAAAQVALDEEGECIAIALGVGGVGDRPLRLDMSSLVGSNLNAAVVSDAVNAATETVEVMSDLHASAAYRRRVARTLCLRAIDQARTDAAGKSGKAAR